MPVWFQQDVQVETSVFFVIWATRTGNSLFKANVCACYNFFFHLSRVYFKLREYSSIFSVIKQHSTRPGLLWGCSYMNLIHLLPYQVMKNTPGVEMLRSALFSVAPSILKSYHTFCDICWNCTIDHELLEFSQISRIYFILSLPWLYNRPINKIILKILND